MMNLKLATILLFLVQLIHFSGCGKLEELSSGEETTSPPANGSRTTSNTPISFDKNNPKICADYLGHYAIYKINDKFAERTNDSVSVLYSDMFHDTFFNLVFIWDTCELKFYSDGNDGIMDSIKKSNNSIEFTLNVTSEPHRLWNNGPASFRKGSYDCEIIKKNNQYDEIEMTCNGTKFYMVSWQDGFDLWSQDYWVNFHNNQDAEDFNSDSDTGEDNGACGIDGNFTGVNCKPITAYEKGDITDGTELGETMLESYAKSDVNCDGTLVDFPDHSFVMEFEVDDMVDGYPKIQLPTVINSETNFYVDWGDGSCNHIESSSMSDDLIHNYSSTGPVRIMLIGNVNNWGYSEVDPYSKPFFRSQLTKVINLGDVSWVNLSYAFYNTPNLSEFSANFTNTSNITDMSYMFSYVHLITNLDLSSFDTSSVTDMRGMFEFAASLTSLDLSNFNTVNVTTMRGMFSECELLPSLDVSNFDTSSVTDMSFMFYGMNKLTSLDLSNFVTSNVTLMVAMLAGAASLASLDVSNFDTSNVISTELMFSGMSGLASLNLGFWEKDALLSSYSFMDGAGVFSSNGINNLLYCENDDDPTRLGNELIIDGKTYSCDGAP